MDDIVCRLRQVPGIVFHHSGQPGVEDPAVCQEAALVIERLRATLRQIADSGNSINAHLAAQALETEHGNG